MQAHLPTVYWLLLEERTMGNMHGPRKDLPLLQSNIYYGYGPFPEIRNDEITVFLSVLLGTIVTATISQNIK